MNKTELYIGAMSGTSADSIDTVLVDLSSHSPQIVAHHDSPLPHRLQKQVVSLSSEQNDSLTAALLLDRELGFAFADAINQLVERSGVEPEDIRAVGSHGQTLRHQTQAAGDEKARFTYQVGDPSTIAELTGIDVVADFRRRDIAAGGEAAPLAPGFHFHFFSHPDKVRAIVNIGGFTNVTLLAPGKAPLGFDVGPGNCLMDGWIERHLGKPLDAAGRWAASGSLESELLDALMSHEYFQRPIPKSTGRELFNLAWLDTVIGTTTYTPENVQRTLMQLTVNALTASLDQLEPTPDEIFICGGGAQNPELLAGIAKAVNIPVETTLKLGIDPKLVEGCAFAWMAKRTLENEPANLPSVTGARGPRILGGIYRA